MRESEPREPQKETIGRAELLYPWHPETEGIFSGYGLPVESGQKDHLVGLLMVDLPKPADPGWLQTILNTFGECQLIPMTASGDRGLACQIQIAADNVPRLRRLYSTLSDAILVALEPLLEQPPAPALTLRWEEEARAWISEISVTNELPREIREVFKTIG